MTGVLAAVVAVALTQAQTQAPTQTQAGGRADSDGCLASARTAVSQATAAICNGEAEERAANAAPRESRARVLAMERAAQQFRRAADVTRIADERVTAVEGLVRMFDLDHLNRPRDQEAALRELIGLRPDDLMPMFRLAQLQESLDLIDSAEDSLQAARRRQPEILEPYRRLAQFYARRAAALQPAPAPVAQGPSPTDAAKPDDTGVYRVGAGIEPPRRDGVAQVPAEARLLGVEGSVRVEVVIDGSGAVTDARVVRSIPLLDDEALRAVRQWRFTPTVVDGKAVPVRMEVVVNFSLR